MKSSNDVIKAIFMCYSLILVEVIVI